MRRIKPAHADPLGKRFDASYSWIVNAKVVVHALKPFESSVENPLGEEGVAHAMWTWPDGSWLMIRFYDDGCVKASTSPGIAVSLTCDDDGTLHAAVSPLRRALQRHSTAENELM